MKKQILIILVALLSSQLFAQVTLSPAYPTADDEVTLTLDVTDTDLENYAGEIYAHTGVNEWDHVIGDWGNNDNQPMLTALGDNKFELLITPDIRQFYGASQSEVLTRMCFVFRAGDGSAQTSPDIFLDIYESLTARFVLPEEETVYKESGESIEVEAAGPFSENMELLINGEIVASSTSTTINYQIDITDIYPDWELQEAIVNAHSAGTTESDTFWFARRPSPNIAAVPDGMVDGINYIDDNTVLLSIFAPYHDYIFVIGDFNNWETEQEYYMNFDENTNRYWLEISLYRNALIHTGGRVSTEINERVKYLKPVTEKDIKFDPELIRLFVFEYKKFFQYLNTEIKSTFSSYKNLSVIEKTEVLWKDCFSSPILPFGDYWEMDSEHDLIKGIKYPEIEESISSGEKVLLSIWRHQFDDSIKTEEFLICSIDYSKIYKLYQGLDKLKFYHMKQKSDRYK